MDADKGRSSNATFKLTFIKGCPYFDKLFKVD